MADSKAVWTAKSLGLVVLAAVLTALLTTGIQQLVWKRSNGGVSGGAAAGVAVAVWMSRRHRRSETPRV
jgi:4-amino-4-deoxy-L-arabinose transferase-like glycosyltransferase